MPNALRTAHCKAWHSASRTDQSAGAQDGVAPRGNSFNHHLRPRGISLPLQLAINFKLTVRDSFLARAGDFADDLAKAQ